MENCDSPVLGVLCIDTRFIGFGFDAVLSVSRSRFESWAPMARRKAVSKGLIVGKQAEINATDTSTWLHVVGVLSVSIMRQRVLISLCSVIHT